MATLQESYDNVELKIREAERSIVSMKQAHPNQLAELRVHLAGYYSWMGGENRAVALQLVKRGPGPVFAGDIDAPSTVEIVNPQHYICTIDDTHSMLEMQLTVERGRGTQLAETVSGMPIGEIAIDALFSPIPRVNFVLEDVGENVLTAHERLVIEIWTDGTVKPGDALSHAAQILAQYFSRIVTLNQPDALEEPVGVAPGGIPYEIAHRSIDELGLSTRTFNRLRRAEIATIGQLMRLDERGLLAIRNLGSKGVDEIRQHLEAFGYRQSERQPAPESALEAPFSARQEPGSDAE